MPIAMSKLSGSQLHDLIARRAEERKLVRAETRTGEGPPPLFELAAAQESLTGEFTLEELDAEIARSRARRQGRK
jgi:hypothetical protein